MEAPRRSSSVPGGKNSVSSQLIGAAVDLLALYNTSGKLNDPRIISQLCVTITRGIDHAIANNEVPIKSRELPTLLQKIDIWKHDLSVVIPFMLLMMSVKIACENGWFQKKETDGLLLMAYEVKRFFSADDVLQGPCHALPSISKIMSRFYPSLKIKNALCFTEVKPGYRTIVADFSLSRGVVASEREMIGMIVARVDDIDTSSCIITPQEVDILLNGKGVPGRNNTSMETVPQPPTDVIAMLKYGVNLLQAVGNFNGPYIIVIAVMCTIATSGTPQLQDYVQPVIASGDTDIKKALQTSLNCPISKDRMRTPVKGHLCKHMQCFDYDNYLSMNSRRPSWQCPLCDEPVSCSDIRIDQNVFKVLREVRENTVHVLVSKDGSWKAVSKNIDPSLSSASKTPRFQEEDQNQSDPLRRNPFREGNYSQQISPTKDIEPSGVNNMHQNTCNSSSLVANCTNLNDHGNKNPRIMDTNPNGMPSAMSLMNDCRGCNSLQKDTELRNQTSRSCINTSTSANTLSSMQNSVIQHMERHIYEPGPVDGSLLTDQTDHRSSLLWQGEDLSDFRLRTGMKSYWDVVTEYTPPGVVLDGIREAGFYGVYETGFMRHDCGLISAFVDRWRPETHTFHLRFGEATITLEDVYYILGLRTTGIPVSGDSRTFDGALVHEVLGIEPGYGVIRKGGIKITWLVQNFASCDRLMNFEGDNAAGYQTLVDFHVRAHLLMIIGSILPHPNGDTVSGHLFHYVSDISLVGGYSWGSACLAWLYRNLCKASMGSKVDLCGSMHLLQVWIYERFTNLAPSVTEFYYTSHPRAIRWMRRLTYVDVPYHKSRVVRYELDHMIEDNFMWRPYLDNNVGDALLITEDDRLLWTAPCPLIYLTYVEWCYTDRVAKQFGLFQPIPTISPVQGHSGFHMHISRWTMSLHDCHLMDYTRIAYLETTRLSAYEGTSMS